MFNRGFRRDDRNSFRSNVNMSRSHNAPSLMSVSPWEGGVVPGSGGSSILGTPQLQGSQGVLTPQAQVLAQNLNILSNLGLLQPHQLQSRQTQALPSLINLGSALNRTLGLGHQNTGYQNRGPGNRFQDQRQKFGRQDTRRTDMFNKNRPRTGQSQTTQQKLQSYRPLNSKLTPLSSTRKPGSQAAAEALAKARADVRGKRPREEPAKTSSDEDADEDESKKEEGEEVVKKRDWKKEKKTDIIEVEDDDAEDKKKEKSDTDEIVEVKEEGENGIKSKDGDKEKNDEEGSGAEAKKEGDGAKPAASNIFNCHVCSKTLADVAALNSHLRTGSHKRMMNQLEDSYAIKVKRIRDQMRMHEQQKEMEMNIRNRGRRTNLQRGHCKMCDLTFVGNITAHRKTPLHIKLKNFLHPNCVPCGKEFPARMEWDMHKLTVEHMRCAAGLDKKGKKLAGTSNARGEPNYARLVPKFPEGIDSNVANMDEEMADKTEADKEGDDDGTITYDPAVANGINMLVHGQHCGVCSKFFSRRPDALEHCKTRSHFDNYLQLKAKLKAEAEEAAAKREAEKQAKAEAEAAAKAEAEAKVEADAKAEAEDASKANGDIKTEPTSEESGDLIEDSKKMPVVCLKRAATRKDEGNWKRSRVKTEDDDENEEEEEEGDMTKTPDEPEVVTEENEDVPQTTEDPNKYDPLQPTSPEASNETLNALDSTLELLQTVEHDLETMDTSESGKEASTSDVPEEALTSKPSNKARRGRKRK